MKTPDSDDQDQLFIDNIIALGSDIVSEANRAKDHTDNPDTLYQLLKMESAALIIQARCRKYRPRLRTLKHLALSTGQDLRRYSSESEKHNVE